MRKTEVIGRMEIQSYKCPNCGCLLVFDPKTQKFKCEYCLSAFTEETLKEMEEAADEGLLSAKDLGYKPNRISKSAAWGILARVYLFWL